MTKSGRLIGGLFSFFFSSVLLRSPCHLHTQHSTSSSPSHLTTSTSFGLIGYYDGATELYEYGWGTSFHFSRFYKGEGFNASVSPGWGLPREGCPSSLLLVLELTRSSFSLISR